MEERKCRNMHVLMIPYPSQGHINPMLQFSKRLSTKGVKVTMVTTIFISKTMHLQSSSLPSSLQFDFISDGYDEGGFTQVGNISTYLSHMQAIGSKNLKELIQKHNVSDHPIDCVVYDPFLQWVLDVAKEFNIIGAAFFTQMCAVNYMYYYVYHGLLKLPISSMPISIPGLPLLELKDTPSFVYDPGFYPAYYEMVMNQYSNIQKADIILVNSFYKLEDQVVDSMSKLCPILTIGPTVPSFYLDKGVPNDKDNDLNLFQLDSSPINWLNSKPEGSAIYVSFGSMVCFSIEQMKEIALGLLGSGSNFLWVIPNMEKKNISKELVEEMSSSGKGLVVNWIPQLEVLSNKAIGCFLTHSGWNSTLEALCLGVPMVAIPQWTDQPLNAKYVEDVWKVGMRVKVNENGIVTKEEIESCIMKVMENDIGREMKINAKKWRELAIEAVSHSGTSHKLNSKTLLIPNSMSPAPMHFPSPINSDDTTPHSPLPFAPFNADAVNPPAAATARGRSKPRLVKLRKQSASQTARSRTRTAATAVENEGSGSGFNPFRSDQVSEGFVFSARKVDSDSVRDLNSEQKESAGVEFVFSAKTNSVSGDESKKLNSEEEKGKVNFTEFVFGAVRNDLHSSFNVEKEKSSVPMWNSGFADYGERECVNEFVFGKQESVDRMRNSGNGPGVFHAETETNGDFDKGGDKCGDLGDDVKSKSGNGSANGFSTIFTDFSDSKLVDEINKLNINDHEGVRIARDSTSSHVSSSNVFVFGGSHKVSSVSSGTNTGGEQLYTNDDSDSDKASGTHGVQNGTAQGIDQDATEIPCSKTTTSQDGIRDFHVSEDAQVNGVEESCTGFKPPAWDPSYFKDNLFCKLNKKFEPTHKSKSSKEKGSKYMRRKLKSHSLNKKQTRLDHLPKENSSLETPESSGGFSPMDLSPYQETTADDEDLKPSEESNVLHPTIATDCKDSQRGGDLDNGKSCYGSSSVGDVHFSGPDTVLPKMQTEVFGSSFSGISADAGVDLTSNSEEKKADVFFVAGLGDSKEKDFAFSAGSTVEGTSLYKRKQKKKFRRKIGSDSFVISPNVNGKPVSSVQFSPLTTANMSSHSDVRDKSQINDLFEEGGDASSATIEAACHQWRLRGNRAHKAKEFSKAEELYTQGINSVPSSERLGCGIKPFLLCYSNRAATRMSLGRIREALEDCTMASSLDPTFLKVQMRTANCHLLLGDVENAQRCYNKCLESGKVVCLDRRVTVEAAEGLQKAQEVVKCMNAAAELLKERTLDAAGSALELLTKALSKSLYSERLLQMKAEALYLLQKYDAAVQLCEQSLNLAEKNFRIANNADNSNNPIHDSYSSVKLWRWSLISKCYFRLGRLDASLNVIEKLQQTASVNDKCVIDIEDLLSLAATIQELLNHRHAGNENFKLGNYSEAVENYTAALSSNIKSRPFAAICFGNRAAAHQASGQIADAIADCSMAMALDENYAKAISRRATLHEMVRDYEQAACDLRRLISVLGSQSNEKAKHSESPNGSSGGKESRQAKQRLLTVEDQAKMETSLDFYLILGIKPSDTAADIKKAYHKAALRHHPDKAGQLLARSEVGDEGSVWKEISQEVHKDADRLFKMIGEAYAVLSDPAKRSEYDLEEDIRKLYKQRNGGGACRRSSDVYGNGRSPDGYRSSYDRTSNRRYGHYYRTYGDSYSRW